MAQNAPLVALDVTAPCKNLFDPLKIVRKIGRALLTPYFEPRLIVNLTLGQVITYFLKFVR